MIPLFKMSYDENDVEEVSKVIKRASHWAIGPEIDQFEKELAEYNQVKYAIVVSNGTTALDLMLKAYGIGKGSNIIVPSFTFISTVNSLSYNNIEPNFCDIEYDTYALALEDVKSKINDNTKGIMLVHYAGAPAYYTRELKELADDKGILLFEDNAESMGANIKGKMVGSFGNSSILSFCQNKMISTGEGGAILTDDKDIADKLKVLRSHGKYNDEFSTLGYNYRIPSMCAALGLSQLRKLRSFINKRRQLAEIYCHRLNKNIKTPRLDAKLNYMHVYQIFPILLESNELRKKVMDNLNKHEIGNKAYFDPPVHRTNYYIDEYGDLDLPVTNDVSDRILTIPLYPSLYGYQINKICEVINEVC